MGSNVFPAPGHAAGFTKQNLSCVRPSRSPRSESASGDFAHNYNRRMTADETQTYEPVVEQTADVDATMVLDPGASGTESEQTVHERAPDLANIPHYALVVHKGRQTGRTWLLSPGVTQVGRHPYSDVALDHITVSRRHCHIELDSRGLSLKDLGSTNGSYVNDRLVEETSLNPGDRLMIGTFHLLVARGR